MNDSSIPYLVASIDDKGIPLTGCMDRLTREGWVFDPSVKETDRIHNVMLSYIKGIASKPVENATIKSEPIKDALDKIKINLDDLINDAPKETGNPAVKLSKEQVKNLPLGTVVLVSGYGKEPSKFTICGFSDYRGPSYLARSDNEDIGTPVYRHYIDSNQIKLAPSFVIGETKVVFINPFNIVEVVSMPKASNNFSSMIKEDLKDTAYRIAATQLTKAAKGAILTALQSQGSNKTQIKTIASMLDTEMGSAVLSVIIGLLLTYAPNISENPKVKILADEFRVAGIAIAGNELADVLLTNVLPVLLQAITPVKEEAKLRVEDHKEELQEEIIEVATKEQRVN